jgi:hypothetical protein
MDMHMNARSCPMLRECVYRFSYDSSDQRRDVIDRYIHGYTTELIHQSMTNAPITRITGNNVLRRNI